MTTAHKLYWFQGVSSHGRHKTCETCLHHEEIQIVDEFSVIDENNIFHMELVIALGGVLAETKSRVLKKQTDEQFWKAQKDIILEKQEANNGNYSTNPIVETIL